MKRICSVLAFSMAAFVATAHAQNTPPATPPAAPVLKTTKDQASYAIGLNIGRSILQDDLDVNPSVIAQGLVDALTKQAPRLNEEQCRAAIQLFQQQMQGQIEQKRQLIGETNKREGAAFLTANKAKPGVTTLPSGLQYQVVAAGNGPIPKNTDNVRVHYHGTLINGTVFDSSIDRKEPAEFPVGGVIRGWTEALQLMKVGSKWRLFIPSELAYGPQGAGGDIGPHAVLVFDVELLAILQ